MNRSTFFLVLFLLLSFSVFQVGAQNLIVNPKQDTTICGGENLLFTADTSGYGASKPVSWSLNGNFKSNDISFTNIFLSEGRDTVVFTIDTLNGIVRDTVLVTTILPEKPAAVRDSVSDCSNQPTPLTIENEPNITYEWRYENKVIHSGPAYEADTFNQGLHFFYVFAKQNGCYSIDSTLIKYEVRPSPIIEITFEEDSGNDNNDGQVCEDDDIKIIAFVTGGSGFQYNWNNSESTESAYEPNTNGRNGTEPISFFVENEQGCDNNIDTIYQIQAIPRIEFSRADGRDFSYGVFEGDTLELELEIENLSKFNEVQGTIDWGNGAENPQKVSISQNITIKPYKKAYDDTSSSTEIKFDLISNEGCIFEDNTQTFSVVEAGKLTPILRVANKTFCPGERIFLDGSQSQPEDCRAGNEIEEYRFEYSLDQLNWEPVNSDISLNTTSFDLSTLAEGTSEIYFRLTVVDLGCPQGTLQAISSIVDAEVERVEPVMLDLCENIEEGEPLNDLFDLEGTFRTTSNLINVDDENRYSTNDVARDTSLFLEYTSPNNCFYQNVSEVFIKNIPDPKTSWRTARVCNGQDTFINLLNRFEYNTWEWSFNGSTLENRDTFQIAGLPADTYAGIIRSQIQIGRGGICVSQDSFLLQVDPNLPVVIEAIDSCGSAVSALYRIDPILPSASYVWSAGPGIQILGPSTGPLIRAIGSGSLAVEVISGCGGIDQAEINSGEIKIIASDTANSREIYSRVCNGAILLVYAEEECGIQWGYYDDEKVEFPFNVGLPYLEVTEEDYNNRTYFALVTKCSNECASEMVDFRSSQNGLISCAGKEDSMTVYPNPASERLNIDFKNLQAGDYYCKLVSSTGKIFQEITFRLSEFTANRRETVLLNSIPSGYYILQVRTNHGYSKSQSIIILN